MLQTYILCRDFTPTQAINEGYDRSICGNCPLRGRIEGNVNVGRACYVSVRNVNNIYRAYRAGKYPPLATYRDSIAARPVRLSAYGDPAAVPYNVLDDLVDLCSKHTGYTHLWRTAGATYRRILMASVHSPHEAREAQQLGWRYFRTRRSDEPLFSGECVCPASNEQNHRTVCIRCLACNGAEGTGKMPVILPHGGKAVENQYYKLFVPERADKYAPMK